MLNLKPDLRSGEDITRSINRTVTPDEGLEVLGLRQGENWVSPPVAKDALETMSHPAQKGRHLRAGIRAHQAALAEMMRRGMWEIADPITFVILPDGRAFIANGHNRLMAVMEHGKPVRFDIAIRRARDEEHLMQMFYRYDVNLAVRSADRVLAGLDPAGARDLPKTFRTATFGAASIINNGMRLHSTMGSSVEALATHRIMDLRLEAANAWWPTAAKLVPLYEKADKIVKRRLLNVQPFAVALLTMKHHEETASKFWRGVAECRGGRGSPTHTLYLQLASPDFKRTEWQHSLYAAAAAWNAYYEGRSLSYIRVNTSTPLKLSGIRLSKA